MKMYRTYLGKLFQKDRKLFVVVAGFLALTLFTNFAKLELTPFFLWGMYSEKQSPSKNYAVLAIKIDGDSLLNYSGGVADNTRFFLSSPLQLYKGIKESGKIDPNLIFFQKKFGKASAFLNKLALKVFNDSLSIERFPDWYAGYLSGLTGRQVKNYSISEIGVHFSPQMFPVADSSKVLLNWVHE